MSTETQSPDRESAASDSHSPTPAVSEQYVHETNMILNHINRRPDDVAVYLETAPYATRGAKCRLSTCPKTIEPGAYRVTLHPGIFNANGGMSLGLKYAIVVVF